jgi:choline kinase
MRLIILAAGAGARLRPLTDDCPKAVVPFLGRPLLDWTMTAARECGLADITIVGGYKSERLEGYGSHLLRNPDFASTGMVATLMAADQYFRDEIVVSYGDIAYRPEVLRALLASPAEIGVVVDLDWQAYWERRFDDPLENAESLRMSPDGTIRSIGQTANRLEDVQGQSIGLFVFRGRGVKALRRAWTRATTDAAYRRPILGHRQSLSKLALTDVLDELTTGDVPIKAIPIHGGWVDIDSPGDLAAAEERWNSATAPVIQNPASPETKATQPSPTEPTYFAQPAFFSYRRR